MFNNIVFNKKKNLSNMIGKKCVCVSTFGDITITGINANRYVFVDTIITEVGEKNTTFFVDTWPHTSSVPQTFFSKTEMRKYIERVIRTKIKKGSLAKDRNNILDNEFVFCTGSVDESSIDLFTRTKEEVEPSCLESCYGIAEIDDLVEKILNTFSLD